MGPASGGTITDLSGRTGDDMLAFTASDWAYVGDTQGDITGCTVSGFHCQGSLAALKIISGTGTAVQGISVTGIDGTTQIHPISLRSDDVGPAALDAISIRDVDCQATNDAQHVAEIVGQGSALTVGTVRLSNLTYRVKAVNPAQLVSVVGNGLAVTVDSLLIDGFAVKGAPSSHFVSVQSNATVKQLAVRNPIALDSTGPQYVAVATGSGVITSVVIDGARLAYGASSAGLVNTSGTLCRVDTISLKDCVVTGGNGIRMSQTATPTVINMEGVEITHPSGGFCVDVANPIRLNLGGGVVFGTSVAAGQIRLVGTAASADIRACTGTHRESRD